MPDPFYTASHLDLITRQQGYAELGRKYWLPSGITNVLGENYARSDFGGAATAPTSGTLRLNGGLVVPRGVTVTNLSAFAVGAGSTMLNQWFCLVDQSGNVLAKTSDDTSAAWGALSYKTLALSTPYTPTATIAVYVGTVVTVSVPPTGMPTHPQKTAGNIGDQLPKIACNSTTGLTNPASLGATVAFGANASPAWVAVS
jgi:hypothetical protein